MLDRKKDTAGKLMHRLNEAYWAWNRRNPSSNTKASLARRCAQLSGEKCTPQTVSSWMSTGRMDKSWIPVVEQVLEATLGFGSANQLRLLDVELGGEAPITGPLWPGAKVTLQEVMDLSKAQRMRLEAAMLTAMADLIEDDAEQEEQERAALVQGNRERR